MTQVHPTVRFVLDGETVQVHGEPPTTTVLNYLRERLGRTGTKEGCAEGDCGACVVLVGELNAEGTAVHYLPLNSCLQLLHTLDGKSVKTVESLTRSSGALHPVQQALVDFRGSQCGFCTPGVVMSLAGLMHTEPTPSRSQITDALAGNLCRCTGYKPIIEAAQHASAAGAVALRIDDAADLPLLRALRDGMALEPAPQALGEAGYVAPRTIAALASYLMQYPDATLLAGSTEVGLQVNKQFARPQRICYLGQVLELRRVHKSSTSWRIGAQVSLTEVEQLVREAYPDFAEVLRRFGSPPIRSTATLAGNIANGSPIGDSMPCLLALGATLHLRRGDATRVLALEDFYTGQKQNVLTPGEFIEAVELPKPLRGHHFHARKVSKRFEQDISATCCALHYRLVKGVLKDVRLAYNGLTPYPSRAPLIEAVLEGSTAQAVTAEALDAAIAASFTPRDGLRATWTYRALIARNLVLQFLESAVKEVTP